MNVFGVKETDEEEPRPKNEFVLQKIVFRDEVHAALKFHFSGKTHKTSNGLKCANCPISQIFNIVVVFASTLYA